MLTQAKAELMDREMTVFLDRHLSGEPNYKASLLNLWRTYLALGLPNAHFVSEFTNGKRESLLQFGWQMMLARHLDAQGYLLTSPDHGPDFRFEHRGLIVWVEAIAPEPKGLPADWMTLPTPNTGRVGTVPHDEILLRWTAAFKEKWEKLGKYRKDGIVGANDAYVIAINGCQLGALPLHHGISRYPYALETVYPVGPLAFHVDLQTHRIGNSFVSERFSIRNANGSPIHTTPFVNPAYSGVSAIIACTMDRSTEPSLLVDVIHNHFAAVHVPERLFGSKGDEWATDPVGTAGEEIDLRRLAPYVSAIMARV